MNENAMQSLVEEQLERIEQILGSNYKLTLIATHNGAGGLRDADIMLTMVDRKAILRAVDRFYPPINQEK